MITLWRIVFWLGLVATSAGESNWAVVIAGSRGFTNYRHQADVCHAYHVVRRNGIPAENVILMTYGDAVDSVENPFPGQLFNKPTPDGVAGYDVNRACSPSYTGEDVTADNFLAVLKGDNKTTEGKPVLRSTKEDRVFVYFADHGGVGLVAMPAGDPVYAQDLIDALRYMSTKGMYKELVFYMEACESGSMFEGLLPEDANIYATTAANSQESSYGTYCGMESSVNGTLIGSCLGDLYSVNFLENSDEPSMFHTETLDSQFALVKNETSRSHAQKFGTLSMGTDHIEWFLGAVGFPSVDGGEFRDQAAAVARIPAPKNGVNSRDIKLHALRYQRSQLAGAGRTREADNLDQQIAEEMAMRFNSAKVFREISRRTSGGAPVPPLTGVFTEHSCLKAASTAVIASCGPWNDFSLTYVRSLATLCQAGYHALQIQAAAEAACRVDV
ncbi:unnamed protein product [Ectocarpus sp. 4 AP-2014]